MAKRGSRYITTGERVRSFIGWAFVISLLVHLAFGSVLPNFAQHHEEQEVEKVSMAKKTRFACRRRRRRRLRRRRLRRRPRSQRRRRKSGSRRSQSCKVNLVQRRATRGRLDREHRRAAEERQPGTASRRDRAPETGAGAHAPAGTPKPACANPERRSDGHQCRAAGLSRIGARPGLGAVTVEVEVTVGPWGNLVEAKVYKSRATWRSIRRRSARPRQSTYSPKLIECQPTTGDYIFRADFQPD